MNIEDLSAEQLEKAKACTTKEELAAFFEAEGFDLSDEELNAFAGGAGDEFAGIEFGCLTKSKQ